MKKVHRWLIADGLIIQHEHTDDDGTMKIFHRLRIASENITGDDKPM